MVEQRLEEASKKTKFAESYKGQGNVDHQFPEGTWKMTTLIYEFISLDNYLANSSFTGLFYNDFFILFFFTDTCNEGRSDMLLHKKVSFVIWLEITLDLPLTCIDL